MSHRILVAPLDWGLGHATRCLPVIEHLQYFGHEVILGGSGDSLRLLQHAFPSCRSMELPAYNVEYDANHSAMLSVVKSSPQLIKTVKRENNVLNNWLQATDSPPTHILSDNRYGVYNEAIPSIFMGHQVNLKAGIFGGAASKVQRKFISKFDHWIIPDHLDQPGLAGELSHPGPKKIPSTYIGPLSRMKQDVVPHEVELLIVISGPPPRSYAWADRLVMQVEEADLAMNTTFVVGWEQHSHQLRKTDITINYLPQQEELNGLLLGARCIICRSGYSTIMDLAKLKRHAIVVPTPGQAEQEYLARLHHGKTVLAYSEKNFSPKAAVEEFSKCSFSRWAKMSKLHLEPVLRQVKV